MMSISIFKHSKQLLVNSLRVLRSSRYAIGILLAFGGGLPMAYADGIHLSEMKSQLTQTSIDLLTNDAHPSGAVDGDIIEFVLEATVMNNKGIIEGSGPASYFTAYLPPGVEVLGASFVTDSTGAVEKAPDQGGLAADGVGLRGDQAPFGAPFAASENGRQNDLYGDTGIFYSTDSITTLVSNDGSKIAKGPTIGDPGDTASTSNGIDVTDTNWGAVDAFN